jgi:hypothetical protein
MPSKSDKQRKYIFFLRNKYGSKSNTPEAQKWIWEPAWKKVESIKENLMIRKLVREDNIQVGDTVDYAGIGPVEVISIKDNKAVVYDSGSYPEKFEVYLNNLSLRKKLDNESKKQSQGKLVKEGLVDNVVLWDKGYEDCLNGKEKDEHYSANLAYNDGYNFCNDNKKEAKKLKFGDKFQMESYTQNKLLRRNKHTESFYNGEMIRNDNGDLCKIIDMSNNYNDVAQYDSTGDGAEDWKLFGIRPNYFYIAAKNMRDYDTYVYRTDANSKILNESKSIQERANSYDFDKLVKLFIRIKNGQVDSRSLIGYGFDLRNPGYNNEERIISALSSKLNVNIDVEDVYEALRYLHLKSLSDLISSWIEFTTESKKENRIVKEDNEEEWVIQEFPSGEIMTTLMTQNKVLSMKKSFYPEAKYRMMRIPKGSEAWKEIITRNESKKENRIVKAIKEGK